MGTSIGRSETTKAKLMSHGAKLFARHGYKGTTLDAVAQAAKVNKAMVSYHFGGKQGLYSAVLSAAIRAAAARLEPARDVFLPAPERLRRFIECLAGAFGENPEFAFIVSREVMAGGSRIEDDVLEEFVGFYELDREILQAGMEAGEFREVDPHEVHLSLVGSLAYFLTSQSLRTSREGSSRLPRSPAYDSYVAHVTDIFLKGLHDRR